MASNIEIVFISATNIKRSPLGFAKGYGYGYLTRWTPPTNAITKSWHRRRDVCFGCSRVMIDTCDDGIPREARGYAVTLAVLRPGQQIARPNGQAPPDLQPLPVRYITET